MYSNICNIFLLLTGECHIFCSTSTVCRSYSIHPVGNKKLCKISENYAPDQSFQDNDFGVYFFKKSKNFITDEFLSYFF